jgi:hypothetical protein
MVVNVAFGSLHQARYVIGTATDADLKLKGPEGKESGGTVALRFATGGGVLSYPAPRTLKGTGQLRIHNTNQSWTARVVCPASCLSAQPAEPQINCAGRPNPETQKEQRPPPEVEFERFVCCFLCLVFPPQRRCCLCIALHVFPLLLQWLRSMLSCSRRASRCF